MQLIKILFRYSGSKYLFFVFLLVCILAIIGNEFEVFFLMDISHIIFWVLAVFTVGLGIYGAIKAFKE